MSLTEIPDWILCDDVCDLATETNNSNKEASIVRTIGGASLM